MVSENLECKALGFSDFQSSIEKSGVILVGFTLYVTCVFPLEAFNISYLFSIFIILTVSFLFLVGVLGACTCMHASFLCGSY